MNGSVQLKSNALVIKNNSKVVEAIALQKSTEASIVMTILNISDTILKNGDIICQQFGITTQQWLVLLHLAADPNIAFVEDRNTTRPGICAASASSITLAHSCCGTTGAKLGRRNFSSPISSEPCSIRLRSIPSRCPGHRA